MRKSAITGLAVGVVLAAGASLPAAAVDSGMSDLSVLHGIPDTTVDVYVNGDLTLDNFAPGDLAGPLSLAPGVYSVAIAGETSTSATDGVILGPIDITLAADTSYTAVAHLKADDAPTVSLFTNDISATAAGEGRLTVRHVAGAPAVDVLANGEVAFPNLENPNEVMADLPVATYSAAVNLKDTDTTVIGPADVPVTEGVNTIVYAWGSAAGENLTVAVQAVDTHQGAPAGVFAGSAPVSDGNSLPIGLIAIAGLALVGAGVAGRVAVSRR